jgi:hypothetical protein
MLWCWKIASHVWLIYAVSDRQRYEEVISGNPYEFAPCLRLNKWADSTHVGHLRSLSTVGQGRRNRSIVTSEMGPVKICPQKKTGIFVENLSYNF